MREMLETLTGRATESVFPETLGSAKGLENNGGKEKMQMMNCGVNFALFIL